MQNKFLIPLIFLGLLVAFGVGAAENPFNIKFPIPELGNCGSMEECRVYCDESQNIDSCISYGEKHGLIKKEEAKEAQKFTESIRKRDFPLPDCDSHESCGRKCGLPENREACFKWAKERGFVKEEDRPEPNIKEPEINKEKALQAIQTDGGPGGCGSFEACGKFCSGSDPKNHKACFEYAKKHNLMPESEIRRAEKFMEKPGPGGCQGEACRDYCEKPANHDECFNFAKENGFISEEEIERIEKFKANKGNLESFGGPGGCKDEEECHKYCSEPEHTQECIDFAKNSGFIRHEEAEERFEKFKGRIENVEDFRKYEHREGSDGQFQGDYQGRQEEQGDDRYRQRPPMPPSVQDGPGGCSRPEECIKFCSQPENAEKCGQFRSKKHEQRNEQKDEQPREQRPGEFKDDSNRDPSKPRLNHDNYNNQPPYPDKPEYQNRPMSEPDKVMPSYQPQQHRPEDSYQPRPSYQPMPPSSENNQYPSKEEYKPMESQPHQPQPEYQPKMEYQQTSPLNQESPMPMPPPPTNSLLQGLIRYISN